MRFKNTLVFEDNGGKFGRTTIYHFVLKLSLTACLTHNVEVALASNNVDYAISMHGDIALHKDFENFPYVNPAAPKGGSINYGIVGSFDSLNPYILSSMRTTASGLQGAVFETLMQRSQAEPFTLYGLLAEKVKMDEERSFIEFRLNPKAKWSDGQAVTTDDILFTYDLLTKKGRPPYSSRMKQIERIEIIDARNIRFVLKNTANREFPLLIAMGMPVLPRHAINPGNFDKASLKPPVGSGPYLVENVEPGSKITYRRNINYWGRDLPTKRGFDNFDTITISYFLNKTSLFEAFKKGLIDVFAESDPRHWEKAYDFPAIRQEQIERDSFVRNTPPAMMGFVFNTRRAIFADVKVRRALSVLLDFGWINRTFFAGRIRRIDSFWQDSELSSIGVAASPKERALLAPFGNSVLPDVMEGNYRADANNGDGSYRSLIKQARDLLIRAGYAFSNGVAHTASGERLRFEIMTMDEEQQRISLVYQRALAKLGIDVVIRAVDDAQFQRRLQTFDYDMTIVSLTSSRSPGTEQWLRWGTASRDIRGSFNYAGANNPAIDTVIDDMLQQTERGAFIASARALDRLLISGCYFIPFYYVPEQQIAHWSRIQHPENGAVYDGNFSAWWRSKG
ncbi:extracellular solute-binding protein [Brucella pituitosa]|uniref:extracellular solute-binding protein n=1 Tax=Brucella pituitosa TaxID=571256 RepID=UPI0009A1A576|nr:extracellular solute-binding protein [Brucella pituitosa]